MPAPNRTDERELLERLRSGDESAFADLVDTLHGRLLALARTFTRSAALAEDIAQETWLAVIRGLPRFEGRSSLRTWIFSILVRRARTMAVREARRAATSPPARSAADGPEWEPGSGRVGLWTETPIPWGLSDPASIFQSKETLEVVETAVASMPEMQRRVLWLRDVEDVPPADLCNILEISETNLRVLLHRARARVRRALDHYLRDGGAAPDRPYPPAGRAAGARPGAPQGRVIRAQGGPHGLS